MTIFKGICDSKTQLYGKYNKRDQQQMYVSSCTTAKEELGSLSKSPLSQGRVNDT